VTTVAGLERGAVAVAGPISIIYRDDVTNVRRMNGIARYGALLGRDRSVPFTVENERAELVCNGTFNRSDALRLLIEAGLKRKPPKP